MLPLSAATLAFVLGRRALPVLLTLSVAATMLAAAMLAWQVAALGPVRHAVGGWGAPLGIELYADGLSALMLLMTAVVGGLVSVYAWAYFAQAAVHPGCRARARERNTRPGALVLAAVAVHVGGAERGVRVGRCL